jgi:hypothetical protein
MKKLFLLLVFLCALASSVWATPVTVGAYALPFFNASNIGSDRTLTVSVTSGSPTVTCSNCLSSPSSLVGMHGFRITIIGVDYTIQSIDSASSLTLTTNYAGATNASASAIFRKYVEVRIYASSSFSPLGNCAATGAPCQIQLGTPGSGAWYRRFAASVVNVGGINTLFLPELSGVRALDATTDAPINGNAKYQMGFYRATDGSLIQYYECSGARQLAVPPVTPTSWVDLCAYNSPFTPPPPPVSRYLTEGEINLRFPTCTGGSLDYFLVTGNSKTCLTLSADFDITGGVLSVVGGGGGGGGYNRIQEDGSNLTQRSIVNFGAGIVATDDAGNSRTNVTVPIMVGDAGAGGAAGLVPAPVTGDATKFLRGDGTWQTVAGGGGGSPGGSNTQLQFNNAGAFGGVSGATSDGTNVTFGSANLRATSPRITTGLLDANGNSLFSFTPTASAVNGFSFTNAAAGNGIVQAAVGSDTNINYTLTPKGAGYLESTGPLRLSGTGVDQFLTPGGINIPTKINVPLYDPGAFGQILALGLEDTAAATARVITLADQRAGGHQPTFMVLSPDEQSNVGITWDGSNTVAKLINSATGGQITVEAISSVRLQSQTMTLNATSGALLLDAPSGDVRVTGTRGVLFNGGAALASLPAVNNGQIVYCNNCNINTDPCTSGGTGAIAFRLNGRWYCP